MESPIFASQVFVSCSAQKNSACGAIHGGRHCAGLAVELRRLGKALEDDDLGTVFWGSHGAPNGPGLIDLLRIW